MGSVFAQCMRVILVIFNFVIVLIGLVTLGFAVYAYLESASQDLIEASGRKDIVNAALFTLMGIGGLTLIVALFGCCGAYHESSGLLATYFTFLMLIFITQIVSTTLGYIYRDELLSNSEMKMDDDINQYLNPRRDFRPDSNVAFMGTVQKLLACCGINGPSDYVSSSSTDGPSKLHPTCCNASDTACSIINISLESAYQEGCLNKYKGMAKQSLYIFFLVIVTMSAFEILGLLFAVVMCCSLRKSNVDYYEVGYTAAG